MRDAPNMPAEIANAFKNFPENAKGEALRLREMIFDTARNTPEIGPLEETLKWGEPAYVTAKTKAGSTLRIAPVKGEDRAALYMICTAGVVEDIREIYPDAFDYGGNRMVAPKGDLAAVEDELRHAIALTLTKKLRNRRKA